MSPLLASLWPLFALILAGHVLRRWGFPSIEFWSGAERINYFVLFPALLFSSLASAPLDSAALPRLMLALGLVFATAWVVLLGLRRLRGWPASRFGVLVQGNLRFNTYIGLAAVAAIFGTEGLALFAVLLALSVPLVNILSVHALTAQGAVSVYSWLVALLKNPLILACLLGGMFNLAGGNLGGGLDNLLGLLAAASLPLGLLCVGAALEPRNLLGETATLLVSSLVRLLLMPACAWLLVSLLGMPAMETTILVLFFALPCASTAYVLTRQLGGDGQLMAGIITLQTLLAMLFLPAWLYLLL